MRLKISTDELKRFADFVHAETGILLDERKAYLFESRLGPLLPKFDVANYDELLRRAQTTKDVRAMVIDGITTQETSFFRDNKPFELLKHKIFPEFFEVNGMHAPLRIWSAASSTGQEVYSIAMCLQDILFDLTKYNIHILATDISDAALSVASMGRYSKFELARGLDAAKLHKYFAKENDIWRIRDEIRQLVKFRQLNLLKPLTVVGRQDLILCRNVAIYFSREDRTRLYAQLADRLNPDGVLIVSSTETLTGITDCFKQESFHGAVYYRKAA